MKTRQKLAALREVMEKRGIQAYLVPSTDPHQSEYVPSCWLRRGWLSGFTGSAGDVVVTLDKAGLWTDGRYFLQAEHQLKGSGVKLYRMGDKGVPSIEEFLANEFGEGDKLGADPRVLSLSRAAGLEEALAPVGAKLRLIDANLVDAVWKDQPALPLDPVMVLNKKFTGESTASKLRRIRKEMKAQDVHAHVLTTLDAIAWTFNIRGADVAFNPVAISYAIITPKDATLFVQRRKITPAVKRQIGSQVTIRAYDAVEKALSRLKRRRARVWVDGATANRWIVDLLKGCDLVTASTPVDLMKARKNPVEVKGMRAAHKRDGVAMVRFLRWLEESVPDGEVTEISASDQLARLRARGRHFQGLSFDTISGYADHGAIIHYSADEESDAKLKERGIYLIDSGGQYLDGTTDITRTVLLGKRATREQKERFTRVLKGHIALARARFPEGVRGMRLDTLARMPLWEAGLDYNHGTGHGVGAFLNVHEGPQSISYGRCKGIPLEEGNVQSNEPGYYEPGEYGIRIENLVVVERDRELSRNGTTFYRFDTLTLCPIDTQLVEKKLLNDDERKWLNSYHRTVKATLSGRLGEKDRRWLSRKCRPV